MLSFPPPQGRPDLLPERALQREILSFIPFIDGQLSRRPKDIDLNTGHEMDT